MWSGSGEPVKPSCQVVVSGERRSVGQATGPFAQEGLIDLDGAAPNFSTPSRHRKTLKVNIAYRGSQGPLHLLIDSTGIKVEGKGEWNARKHGGIKRPAPRFLEPMAKSWLDWRQIHIGIDEQTLEIRSAEFTTSDVDDGPIPPEWLSQIPVDQEIARVTADGACDTRKCHIPGIDELRHCLRL